ncbi:MAG: cobalt transporter CbiM [Deltaproteobacteria bacterium]|jgi:cobalt/nickel transport system permease protein|nr:cobalt transporter CbiM [Deltaproteobacteria bacterium]
MHISEGVLSAPVLLSGGALAVLGLAYSLRKMPWQHIMSVGVLAAGFFVASLAHIPIGPSSVHLILGGLMGAALGWAAFPAISVAMFLQALLLQFGGLTSLGANISIVGYPAVFCGLALRPFLASASFKIRNLGAFFCGFLSVLFSAALSATALAASGADFFSSAWMLFTAHVPVMFIEGLLTVAIVNFVIRVTPDLLGLAGTTRYEV